MSETIQDREKAPLKIKKPKQKKMPFKNKKQMIAMLLSKDKKTKQVAKTWLKKYGPPKKKQ